MLQTAFVSGCQLSVAVRRTAKAIVIAKAPAIANHINEAIEEQRQKKKENSNTIW